MDVDEIMDVANQAVEDIFGREVVYTPAAGGSASTFRADFQERYELLDADGMTVGHSGRVSALDVRATALDALELVPRQGDRVSFSVRDETRTYRIADVRTPAPGSVLLVLGDRT